MQKIKHILSALCLGLLAVSCAQEMETPGGQGYLVLEMNTLVSTHTRASAPADYDARQLTVEIKDAQGNVVKTLDNVEPAHRVAIEAGSYTVVAHSRGWDGNGSGFDAPYYYGSTAVTIEPRTQTKARITCTQANVKVTVNFDPTFQTNFTSAKVNVASDVAGVSALSFVMGQNLKPGYFPAGKLTATLNVTNHGGVANSLQREFTQVQPRDHYVLNFKMAPEGQLGDGTQPAISVEVDETTSTYTYTFQVPKKAGTALFARPANTWSTFAYLNGAVTSKTASFQPQGLSLQWRAVGAAAWNEIPYASLAVDADDNITMQLKGLTPATTYEYRVRYVQGDDEVLSDPAQFTTETQTALYNGGFESWWIDKKKVAYPNQEGVSYWDTSNQGSVKAGSSITVSETGKVHGGATSAKLSTKSVIGVLAAASMYTGSFGGLIGMKGAKLNWGVLFNSRPTALRGYIQYAPAAVSVVSANAPSTAPGSGQPDQCGLYCALLTEQLLVDNTRIDETFPNWQTDPRVIAYGQLPDNQNVDSKGEWKEVNIPLVYNNPTAKPTHLLVVFSSSRYGDYFHGGDGSTLYLDDFELVYGDEPALR